MTRAIVRHSARAGTRFAEPVCDVAELLFPDQRKPDREAGTQNHGSTLYGLIARLPNE
jgi:hypothetical protein